MADTTTTTRRALCSRCGGYFLVKRDGTMRRHHPEGWSHTCAGSGELPGLSPTPIPTTCQHPGCGAPIRHAGFGYEHDDGRLIAGHIVDLGEEYRTAQRELMVALKARATARRP